MVAEHEIPLLPLCWLQLQHRLKHLRVEGKVMQVVVRAKLHVVPEFSGKLPYWNMLLFSRGNATLQAQVLDMARHMS